MRRGTEPYIFPAGAHYGADSLVLHAHARRHAVRDFAGPLSVKTVLQGEVTWFVAGRRLVVEPGTFLILGDGERYSMEIDELEPVETCCLFFRRGFVEGVARDRTSPLEQSLAEPDRPVPHLRFPARLHANPSGAIARRIGALQASAGDPVQPLGFDERLLHLAKWLLDLHEEIRAQVARVPAAKASTREELYRRLQFAKEALHAGVDQPPSLQNLATLAHLSPYHLHRAFRRAFGQTPFQYATALKLRRARRLLQSGAGVTEAALAAGFASPAAFARRFRAFFGVAPSSFRP